MTSDEATLAVIEAIEAEGVDYMLVGSFSSNCYGVVRSTMDADIVVSCPGNVVRRIVSHLDDRFQLDPQTSFEVVTGTTRSVVEVRDGSFRIEIFRLSDDDHDQERFRHRRRIGHPTLGRECSIPRAEDVIVTKLRWAQSGRSKDRDDIRDILLVQTGMLDLDEIRQWARRHGTIALLEEILQQIGTT